MVSNILGKKLVGYICNVISGTCIAKNGKVWRSFRICLCAPMFDVLGLFVKVMPHCTCVNVIEKERKKEKKCRLRCPLCFTPASPPFTSSPREKSFVDKAFLFIYFIRSILIYFFYFFFPGLYRGDVRVWWRRRLLSRIKSTFYRSPQERCSFSSNFIAI